MSMRCARNILSASTVLDSKDTFRDHFSGIRAYTSDMSRAGRMDSKIETYR